MGKNVSQILSKFLKDNVVVHELTCVFTHPLTNRVAESKNYHPLEVPRNLLFQMPIPKANRGELY